MTRIWAYLTVLAALWAGAAQAQTPSAGQTPRVEPIAVAAGEALTVHAGGRRLRETGEDATYGSQWPGGYFEAGFNGSFVDFRVVSGAVRLMVSVDGQGAALVRPGPGVYRVSAAGEGDHRLRIDIVSEMQAGPVVLGGVFGRPAAAPLTPRRRQIEFIGDSHTVGYGNTSASQTCTSDEIWERTDTRAGLAGQFADRFDADYQVNAISGRGVVRNYDGFAADTLPQAYPYVLFDKQMRYEDPDWHPQVIVVALGTNDFSTPLRPEEPWKTRDALTADYETQYLAFLHSLRVRDPNARILLWGPDGSEMAQAGRRVAARAAEEGPVTFVAVGGLTLRACDWHPDVADDRTVADALAKALSEGPNPWPVP